MAKKDAEEQDILQDEFLEEGGEAATAATEEWLGEETYEGQLAVDVYQTKDSVVIKAPIAGVSKEDLDVSVANDVVTLRGERKEEQTIEREHYYIQECYWGSFSRSVILPTPTVAEKAKAILKDGVLTISIPKVETEKVKKITIESA